MIYRDPYLKCECGKKRTKKKDSAGVSYECRKCNVIILIPWFIYEKEAFAFSRKNTRQ